MAKLPVLAAMIAFGMLFTDIWFPSYSFANEGVCFYFDRVTRETGEESGSEIEDDRTSDGTGGMVHWRLGDTLMREIDGKSYRFRCIDQNYSDSSENHRSAALFLCDSVIPANTGSRYEFEILGDGSHGYVFHPGPIVRFGDSNEYRYSQVRSWLCQAAQEDIFADALQIHTGISRAYTGSTKEQMFEQLDEDSLRPVPIGSQVMTDQMFLLSVDEAVKYRQWLWRFEGSEDENPQTQIEAYCKGYWLRSPAGSGADYDTGQVYVVDLVHGNLHPAPVMTDAETGELGAGSGGLGAGAGEPDVELWQTSIYGVRPAFALLQDQLGTESQGKEAENQK